jgi:hypothetical protein
MAACAVVIPFEVSWPNFRAALRPCSKFTPENVSPTSNAAPDRLRTSIGRTPGPASGVIIQAAKKLWGRHQGQRRGASENSVQLLGNWQSTPHKNQRPKVRLQRR